MVRLARELEIRGQRGDFAGQGRALLFRDARGRFGGGEAGEVRVGGGEEILTRLLEVGLQRLLAFLKGNTFGGEGGEFCRRLLKVGSDVCFLVMDVGVRADCVFVACLQVGEGGFEVGKVRFLGGVVGELGGEGVVGAGGSREVFLEVGKGGVGMFDLGSEGVVLSG